MLLALNKIDAVPDVSSPVSEEEVSDAGKLENWTKRAGVPEDVVASFDAIVATSATTRFGLSDLEEALASIIGAGSVNAEGAQWAANQRQAEALRCACAALDRLTETIEHGLPVDFWTIELREAAAALGEITGRGRRRGRARRRLHKVLHRQVVYKKRKRDEELVVVSWKRTKEVWWKTRGRRARESTGKSM
jgi:tRNA U34 5-carboxymethylaminomethyl modifying GTPase MnmE/TrmE